ncbi:MAG: serine hydrolase [Desulfobacteraceae bacterium]|nr:serine hydrolase [Desulfobacteraceae bacterium]
MRNISNCINILILFFILGVLSGCDDGGSSGSNDEAEENVQSYAHTWYEDNPTYFDSRDDTASWDFSTPEAQGMDSQILEAGVVELESEPYLFSLLIIRHNNIVFERYFNGSAANHSNNIHSASKSMLSALVGIAIREGYIDSVDEKVSDILPEYFPVNDEKRNITLHHLMTMSAGLSWSEDRTEYAIEGTDDWVQGVLERRLLYTPGEHFNYSTGLAHVMSAVITRATGMSTYEFARQYLFEPIGITVEHWGRDPQGIYSGGYNLYMTPREMAKFGLLYLYNGLWDDEQIVPQWMVDNSVEPYFVIDGLSDYGYYWWLLQINGYETYEAWGWGGQFIYVIPELDLVWVTTADTWNNNRGEEIDAVGFISNVIIPAFEDSP